MTKGPGDEPAERETGLEGDRVEEITEASAYDLILKFESGRELHVHDAKWHVSEEET